MRKLLTSLSELAGGVCLVVAAYMVAVPLGFAATGALLVAAGVLAA